MQSGLYGRSMPLGMSSYGMNMGMPQMSMNQSKGKGREIDFDAAFAQVHASLANQVEGARITEVTDEEAEQLASTLESVSLEKEKGKGKAGEETDEASFKEYAPASVCASFRCCADYMRACRVWEQLQNSDLPPPEEDVAKWEAQFNQLMNSQREDLDFDYGGMMKNAWDGVNSTDFSPSPPLQFDDQGIPTLGDYVFGASSLYAFFR